MVESSLRTTMVQPLRDLLTIKSKCCQIDLDSKSTWPHRCRGWSRRQNVIGLSTSLDALDAEVISTAPAH